MYRWLNELGIKVVSEKKQRAVSKQLITTQIVGEIAPFTRAVKGGGEEIRRSAMIYVPYLPEKVTELLEQYAR